MILVAASFCLGLNRCLKMARGGDRRRRHYRVFVWFARDDVGRRWLWNVYIYTGLWCDMVWYADRFRGVGTPSRTLFHYAVLVLEIISFLLRT